VRATAATRRSLRARRRLAELDRLAEEGVRSADAALVLAEVLSCRWSLRGDTAQAYSRHGRHASPLARERHANRTARARRSRRAAA
jgi:hypothetical protein